jgi:hypothetical protein
MAETPEVPLSRFSRAQERFLGLTSYQSRTDAQAHLPTSVRITVEARRRLLAYFYSPGAFRSGPLFGRRNNGVVVITDAARGTPPGITQEDPDNPFVLDARYVLGWSDCLTEGSSNGIDWIGHWAMAANNHLGSHQEHLLWLHDAQRAALADNDTFLLTLGHEAEQVKYRALIVEGKNAAILPVTCLTASQH